MGCCLNRPGHPLLSLQKLKIDNQMVVGEFVTMKEGAMNTLTYEKAKDRPKLTARPQGNVNHKAIRADISERFSETLKYLAR